MDEEPRYIIRRYVDYVYDIVSALIHDEPVLRSGYIERMVGEYGLNALLGEGLLIFNGSINGERLYFLKERKGR